MSKRLMPYTQEEIDEQLKNMIDPHVEAFAAGQKLLESHPHVEVQGDKVGAMLDALAEALRDDMESGAAWMNEAATTEFEKKYPRFVMLFNNARRIDWTKGN